MKTLKTNPKNTKIIVVVQWEAINRTFEKEFLFNFKPYFGLKLVDSNENNSVELNLYQDSCIMSYDIVNDYFTIQLFRGTWTHDALCETLLLLNWKEIKSN